MSTPNIPKRATLSSGAHATYGLGTCIMELIDYLDRRRNGKRVLRSDHLTDSPDCTCPVIAAFMRSWNDSLPDADRDRLLMPLLPLLLDTNTGRDDSERRAWMATDWLVRECAPAWLELAGLTEHAEKLRALDEVRTSEDARKAQARIDAARDAARAAARAAARDAAWNAARDAAWNAARDAAWNAAWNAASAAAWNAARDAARDAAWNAASAAADQVLAPTVARLQASAQDLIRRMCAVGRES